MKAVKLNRVYTITEPEMKSYVQQGYDIIDDDGNVVAYGAGKVISFEKHVKVLKAYEALLKEKEALEQELADLKKAKKPTKTKAKEEE